MWVPTMVSGESEAGGLLGASVPHLNEEAVGSRGMGRMLRDLIAGCGGFAGCRFVRVFGWAACGDERP